MPQMKDITPLGVFRHYIYMQLVTHLLPNAASEPAAASTGQAPPSSHQK